MSASVPCYVKGYKVVEIWVEVSAVTLSDAVQEARMIENFTPTAAQYEKPEELE